MGRESLDPLAVTPTNVARYAQNRPSLVAGDLAEFGVEPDVTYRILLARGVFKWLAVRTDLIALKNEWSRRSAETLRQLKRAKAERDAARLWHLRGQLAALNACRKEVRRLCRSPRWRAPEHDDDARQFLERLADCPGWRGVDDAS